MQIGKQTVYLYEGVIPSSGKQVFTFGEHKLVHRSIKADKSDLLVDIDTRAVIMAYPMKTERSVVLNDVANKIDMLNHFKEHPNSYELIVKDKVIKTKQNDSETQFKTFKEPSYSRSGKFANLNKGVKKTYVLKDSKW